MHRYVFKAHLCVCSNANQALSFYLFPRTHPLPLLPSFFSHPPPSCFVFISKIRCGFLHLTQFLSGIFTKEALILFGPDCPCVVTLVPNEPLSPASEEMSRNESKPTCLALVSLVSVPHHSLSVRRSPPAEL